MSTFDYKKREVNCKIVYYGPGLSGKTTNLQQIHEISKAASNSELVSLETTGERTIFFDFLPMEIGTVRGYNVRLHLYTVPGQVIHNGTRKLILQGTDGVVFVADSDREKMSWNQMALANLKENLESFGYDLLKMPYVLQLNKRDLQSAVSISAMCEVLQLKNEPVEQAIATEGTGVFETLMTITRQVMRQLRESGIESTKSGSDAVAAAGGARTILPPETPSTENQKIGEP